MEQPWELISATTIGSHHRDELVPHNGQDALFYHYDPMTGNGLAVVADGCGSAEFSEVGAHLGVRLLADLWDRQGRQAPGYHRYPWGFISPRSQDFLVALIDPLVKELRAALLPFGDINAQNRLRNAIENYGFFTLNGVVWNSEAMVFFCIGDGVTIINDEAIVIEPPREEGWPENAPKYVGYSVLNPSLPVELRYYRVFPAKYVQSFVVASDGFGPLLDAADTLLPGQRRTFGPINQLWTDDKYFTNPSRLQNVLGLSGRTMKKLKRGPDGPMAEISTFLGLLDDDTTMIVGRRQQAQPAPSNSEES